MFHRKLFLGALFLIIIILCLVQPVEVLEGKEVEEENKTSGWITENRTIPLYSHITYECYKECYYKEKMKYNKKEIDFKESVCCTKFDYRIDSSSCGMVFYYTKEKDELKYFYFKDSLPTGKNRTCEWNVFYSDDLNDTKQNGESK